MIFRTLALVLAISVGLAGMASASANHTTHCVPTSEQTNSLHAFTDGDVGQQAHSHVVAQTENIDAGAADCLAHFCSAVLIGLAGCGTASHRAMLMVATEPENLRALSRILGLYRPPSL